MKPNLPHHELAERRRQKRIEAIRAKLDKRVRKEKRAIAYELLTREDVRAMLAEKRFLAELQQHACDVRRP